MPKVKIEAPMAVLAAALLAASCASSPPPPDPALRAAALARTDEGERAFAAGNHNDASLRYGEALAIHRSIDFPPGIARSLLNLATVRIAAGDPAGARDFLDALDRYFATVQASNPAELGRRGLPDLRARAACLRARIEADAGRTQAAWDALARAGEASEAGTVALQRLIAARLHLADGNFPAALASARAALAVCRKAGDRQGEADALRYLGQAALRTAWAGAAFQSFSAALAIDQELARPAKVVADLQGMAAAARAQGDQPRARACADRAAQASQAAAAKAE